MVRRRRLLGLVTGVALLAAACASASGTEVGSGLGSADGSTILDEARVRAATTTIPPTTTTVPVTTTTAPPYDPVNLGEFETLVATVKPEVSVLATFAEPDGEPVHFEFPLTNPTYFENELVLKVTEDLGDGRWLRVQVPVRPNGSEVWIRQADVELSTHRYRAEINVSDRTVRVWNGEEMIADTTAVVGKESTPTPVGSFYVNELVTKWDGSAYGPYILSLSGFSEALETFGGGLPAIAIHGTNRPELMGGAYSNGCIRIPNDVVRVLAETVPMGTPVDIVA